MTKLIKNHTHAGYLLHVFFGTTFYRIISPTMHFRAAERYFSQISPKQIVRSVWYFSTISFTPLPNLWPTYHSAVMSLLVNIKRKPESRADTFEGKCGVGVG